MPDKPKTKKKMGRPKSNNVLVRTYSFTEEPPKMAVFDKLCERLGTHRSTLIKEGLDLVMEKYNEE